ncbi:hypothetical protein B0H16DRAFT_1597226, partial [Mycena metata]
APQTTHLMIDTENAKSKREFKKLSKCMGDKLEKEMGRWVSFLAFFWCCFAGRFFFFWNTESHLATWRRCLRSTLLPVIALRPFKLTRP